MPEKVKKLVLNSAVIATALENGTCLGCLNDREGHPCLCPTCEAAADQRFAQAAAAIMTAYAQQREVITDNDAADPSRESVWPAPILALVHINTGAMQSPNNANLWRSGFWVGQGYLFMFVASAADIRGKTVPSLVMLRRKQGGGKLHLIAQPVALPDNVRPSVELRVNKLDEVSPEALLELECEAALPCEGLEWAVRHADGQFGPTLRAAVYFQTIGKPAAQPVQTEVQAATA